MVRRRLLGLGVILALAVTCLPSLDPEAIGQPAATAKPPSLEPVFGKGADGAWTPAAGTFTVTRDDALSSSILTVGKTPLVLESKAASTGAREMKALVRLRTDVAPGAVADFYLARKDAKDPGLRMLVSTTRGADALSCQVQQG